MIGEYATITALLVMMGVHIYFAHLYSDRMRQSNANAKNMADSPKDTDDHKTSAKTKTANLNNHYALIADGMCVAVLASLIALHQRGDVEAIGWVSLLLLPLPIGMLMYNFCNLYHVSIRGWKSLRSVLLARLK